MGVPTWRRLGRGWGLDVHAAKVVAAIADSESGELAVHRMGGATEQVAEFCAAQPRPVRVAYEAGPTGFGLARALAARGIDCTVAAPGKIERPAQDRVKTDRRDAERLARDWLGRVELPEPVAQSVLLDGLGAIDALLVRRESLESQMGALVEGSPWEKTARVSGPLVVGDLTNGRPYQL